jgi:SAM-dependent methyltransferase
MTSDLATRSVLPHYPRSARYDAQWVIDNVMGPQPLWLLEWLMAALDLPAGARILDLGCGTALTSIFLAKEYDLQVTAADLWVTPAENWRRITAAGCTERVMPLRVEAHELPFAEGYFDAVVSIDAYHYFGTADGYLSYLARFVTPGGRIGVVVPGLVSEFDGDRPPQHLQPYWSPDFWTFHSPVWWRRLWSRSGAIEVESAHLLENGWSEWAAWNELCARYSTSQPVVEGAGREAEMLRIDAGRTLGLARLIGRVKQT